MSIITLLTDFGLEDEYVGLMKGVILSANPSAVIIDITHHVDPHDLIRAAYIILEEFYRAYTDKRLHIKVRESKINGVSPNYESVQPQHLLAIIGGSGYLEIAVNCGSARQYLGAAKGDSVRLIVSE